MTFPLPFYNPGLKYALPGSQTFSTGGAHNFTIPRYKNTLTIEVWGGSGGGATNAANGTAGGASSVSALALSAGGGGAGTTGGAGAGGVASGGTTNTNGIAGSGSTGGGAVGGYGGGGAGGYYTYTVNEGPLYSLSIYHWEASGSGPTEYRLYWGGALPVQYGSGTITSFVIGGVTYYRGTSQGGSPTKYSISRSYTAGAYGFAGGSGAYVSKTFTRGQLTPNAILAFIVGAGGAGGGGAGAGGVGRVKFTWT